jgi:hypothetical protein
MLCCACRKSHDYDQQFNNAEDMIQGKWKLIQYYNENTDGMGQWVPTDTSNVQIIEFGQSERFTHNDNFVIQETIDRYEFLDSNKVLLYSSRAKDSVRYYYQQDNFSELIFNPICTEASCMRKFVRLQ